MPCYYSNKVQQTKMTDPLLVLRAAGRLGLTCQQRGATELYLQGGGRQAVLNTQDGRMSGNLDRSTVTALEAWYSAEMLKAEAQASGAVWEEMWDEERNEITIRVTEWR